MTNWMTAAGIALIAGGIAILIGFRHVLWGAGEEQHGGTRGAAQDRRRDRRAGPRGTTGTVGGRPGESAAAGGLPAAAPRAIEAPRRIALAAHAHDPATRPEVEAVLRPSRPRRRGRATAAASFTPVDVDGLAKVAAEGATDIDPGEAAPARRHAGGLTRRHAGGLARLGLIDDEEPSGEVLGAISTDDEEPSGEVRFATPADDEEPSGGVRFATPAGDEEWSGGFAIPVGDEERSGEVRFATRAGDEEWSGGFAIPVDDEERSGEVRSAIPADEFDDSPMDEIDEPLAHDDEPARDDDDEIDERPVARDDDADPADRWSGGGRWSGWADPDDERHAARVGRFEPDMPSQRVDRYGDRVEGWVRPRYEEQPEPGEYWTPIPDTSYADADYGWPVPVERLPEAPPYAPASGFDPDPIEESEPTAVVPTWPPARPSGRIELPRSWAMRNNQGRRTKPADEPKDDNVREVGDGRPRRSAVMIRRRRAGTTETLPAVSDSTEMLPAVDDREPGPPRRRPRPRPSQPDNRSTVYRSRHAADPS